MLVFVFLLSVVNLNEYLMAPRFLGDKIIVCGAKFQGIYLWEPGTARVKKLIDADGFHVAFSSSGTKLAARKEGDVIVYDILRKRMVKRIRGDFTGYPVFLGEKLLVPEEKSTLVFDENLIGSGKLPFSFTYGTAGNDKLAFSRNDSIFLFDFKKHELKIVRGGDGIYFMPIISPDGNYIVYSKLGYGLYLYDIEKGNEIFVSKGGNPSWRSDSKVFVFSIVEDNGEDITGADLYVYRISDGKVIQLTHSRDVFELLPSFSPDGKKVVYNTFEGKIDFVLYKE
ncbi:MAG: hypothetical protein ABIM02_05185 [candidate division WOR-3 bacterium]